MKDKEARQLLNMKKTAPCVIMALGVIVAILGLCALYLRFAWNRYQRMGETEASQLGSSIASMLHYEHIENLISHGAPDEHAVLVGEALARLVDKTDGIYYAYLLMQSGDGSIKVVADSMMDDTALSSDMRRGCEESVNVNTLPFDTGEGLLSKPVSTICGDWIRALVPIKEVDSDRIVAVLGMSYSTDEWRAGLRRRMLPDFVIIGCVLILIYSLVDLSHKHRRVKKATEQLFFQEALYRAVFEQAPIGIILRGGLDRRLTDVQYFSTNPMSEEILGRGCDELKKLSWSDFTHKDDIAHERKLYDSMVAGEIDAFSTEKRFVRPDGTVVWVHYKVTDLSASSLYKTLRLYLLEDITEHKRSEESLRESERSKSVFFSHLPGMAYRCNNNQKWTMEFVSEGCYALTGYKAASLLGDSEVSYSDLISPEYRSAVRSGWDTALFNNRRYQDEYEIITLNGERKWVLELGQGIYDENGQVEALEGIVLDVTERKRKENQVAYLREHDFLTGLYNRMYIEQEKKRLDRPEFWPLSIGICDIDGLRMINDAYGPEEGDRLIATVARLLRGCLPARYVLGHTGGGEFVLLMPHTDSEAAHRIKWHIKDVIRKYNSANDNALYSASVTVGHGTKESADQLIADITRAAEEYLSSRKLLNRNSSHSAIVSSIMATLYAKSQETEEHGQRLGSLCRRLGERLGLRQKDLDDLQLLSKLHDIGKIGIDDRILNKPGALSEDEWATMRMHPEIGHRIARSTPQLEHIAEYILHHHERWDGTGYPAGLAGEEIPLVSRILSIADAFDAMTEDRIYRRAMSHLEAIEEIKRGAGTQFDPNIAEIFFELVGHKYTDGVLSAADVTQSPPEGHF